MKSRLIYFSLLVFLVGLPIESIAMNVKSIIKQGESETVEFKQSFDKEAVIAIGAFANKSGGTVLIGVDDKGKAKGVDIGKETLQNWVNQIAQATEPKLFPQINEHRIVGKTLVTIQISGTPENCLMM